MISSEILKIGRVIEVRGSKIIGELEASIEDLYRTYKSRKYTIGQVGSIVKIESGNIYVFGFVTSLRMQEEYFERKSEKSSSDLSNVKWIEIELFGQGRKINVNSEEIIFERGVSNYPLPGQPIYLSTFDELNCIYKKPDARTIKIGSLSQIQGLEAYLIMNDFIGKHSALLGTTGSGKSCALSIIINSIIKEHPKAHIILLDPHSEYFNAFKDKSEKIDPTELNIPHWLLNYNESISLFLKKSEHQATSQSAILKDALLKARQSYLSSDESLRGTFDISKITVDTPTPYKVSDLIKEIDQLKPSQESKHDPYNQIINRINAYKEDKRFAFLIRPDEEVKDNLNILLKEMFRIPTAGKPISIIDLSGVPSDVLNVVVSILCRIIFDFALWNNDRRDVPLMFICEEAHRYAPLSEDSEFKNAKEALSRIAKEGRKYGVGLCLVTQRPSEISISLLSQCNTIIALRMNNKNDQEFIERALPDNIKSMVDALPALRTKEALIFGEGTSVPIRVLFEDLPEDKRPKSENVDFALAWKDIEGDEEVINATIKRWREQKRN